MSLVKRLLILGLLISILGLSACKATPEAAVEPPAATEEAAIEATEEVVPTDTPSPEPTTVPTNTPIPPTETPEPTATPEPTETPIPEPTATPIPPTPTPEPVVDDEPAPVVTQAPAASDPTIVFDNALEILEDNDPAPPLTIIVSANREMEGYKFIVSGYLRNDGDVAYDSLYISATFWPSERPYGYGPVRVRLGCPILNPGESCPFILDTISTDLAGVRMHPEGAPTDRTNYAPEAWTSGSYVGTDGFVHITGTVHNPYEATLRNTTLTAALIDGSGEIVSVGSRLILGPLDAGQNASFDIAVKYAPYNNYSVIAQAEAH